MRIVFTSNLYEPLLGGSVVVLERLARQAAEEGHEVLILTKTPGDGFRSFEEYSAQPVGSGNIAVCRFHDFPSSVKILRSANRVVMIEMSLNWLAAIVAARKRPVVTHHTLFMPLDGRMRPYRVLQWLAGLWIPATACSQMIARQWGPHVGVLPNPYDGRLFKPSAGRRDIDFLFVGRLATEKGILSLLQALELLESRLKNAGKTVPRVAFVGHGPESRVIEDFAVSGKIQRPVFLGKASPQETAAFYQRSACLVIPSIWQEPFGLISLEALACGCGIICSDQAGLRESTGNLAEYFPTGDVHALADRLDARLSGNCVNPEPRKLQEHLAKYTATASLASLLRQAERWWNRAPIHLESTP